MKKDQEFRRSYGKTYWFQGRHRISRSADSYGVCLMLFSLIGLPNFLTDTFAQIRGTISKERDLINAATA